MTEIPAKPDPSLFKVDPRTGQYTVSVYIRATFQVDVKAENPEAAQAEVQRMFSEDEIIIYPGAVDQLKVNGARPRAPMFLITRDGQKMQSSHLEPGDLPREPDERGF